MQKLDIAWYVFGAQAVVAHGRPRMTADVDITVALGERDVTALVDGIEKAGFRLRAPYSEHMRVVLCVHDATEMPVDIVVAGPGLEQEFLERAVLIDLGGVVAPLISAEDLVATKILAGRPKDLEDARGIIEEQRRTLDATRVKALLRALESALDRSDLLSLYKELSRVRRSR